MTRVVAVVWNGSNFVLGAVDEGELGYWPLDALGRWTLEAPARQVAAKLNMTMGVASDAAARIELDALREGPIRKDLPIGLQPRIAKRRDDAAPRA